MTKLQTLQKKWYKKLKDSGFEDIENADGNLKSHHNLYFKKKDRMLDFEEKERYYQLAGQLLHSHKFADAKQRNMWALHCEGISQRQIAKQMKIDNRIVYKFIKSLQAFIVVGT